jgi:hypothetical protein
VVNRDLGRMTMQRTTIAGALLVLSSLPWLIPELRVRETAELARLPYAARRARANGPFWISIAEVERRMGTNVPVILRHPYDFDRAVLLTYYLYPRVTHYFANLDHYRALAPAPPETPLAYIDVDRADAVRVMTYPQIRAEQMAEEPFAPPPITSEAARELIIPFAVSFDGADSYVTQTAFRSESGGTLTLTLEPEGRTWSVPLRSGQPFVSRDLTYPMSGWIRVTATVPVRAGAALVNRGRHRIVPIEIYSAIPPLPRRLAGGDKLWLLNAETRAVEVKVNGESVTLKANELRALPAAETSEIEGTVRVLPFTSKKLSDGNTQFVWP